MPRRVMITGISGFVGPYLAEHLLASGDSVLGCSPDGTWNENNSPRRTQRNAEKKHTQSPLRSSSPSAVKKHRVEMIAWDIGRESGLSAAVRHAIERFAPEAIYHLAALSVPSDCGPCEPLPSAMAVNVAGTRRVLELAALLSPPARVLVISTSHVYAPVSSYLPYVTETSLLDPRTGYARSKFLAEEEARRAVCDWGCDAIIARSFNHTGPGQSPRLMLPQWAQQFAAATNVAADTSQLVEDAALGVPQPIKIYTANAYLDLTDVRDVVRAYRLLVEHGKSGKTYNVGSGMNRRSGDVFDLLRSVAGQPDRPAIETQPGWQQGPIADITRLVRATGWCSAIPLEQTVADTLTWWRARSGV